jgi:hypothetical protein
MSPLVILLVAMFICCGLPIIITGVIGIMVAIRERRRR